MKNRIHSGYVNHAHSGWLNGIIIIFGYLWIISGIDKIGSGVFVSGFHNFVVTNYITEGTYPMYVAFISHFVLPYGTFFAYLIEWGELAIGVVMICSAIFLFFRDNRFAHLLLSGANLGGAIIVFNIILAEGGSLLPFINTSIVYEEGVSIDVIVLLVALLVAVANFIAYRRESR